MVVHVTLADGSQVAKSISQGIKHLTWAIFNVTAVHGITLSTIAEIAIDKICDDEEGDDTGTGKLYKSKRLMEALSKNATIMESIKKAVCNCQDKIGKIVCNSFNECK